jgi:predicted N-acetyltransferase YhbS
LVDRKISQQGAAAHLVEYLEKALIDRGAKRLRFFDAPKNYFFPGIPAMDTALICLAEKMGYTRFADTQNMTVGLEKVDRFATEELERSLFAEGIDIKRLETAEEMESLMQLIDQDFPLWRHEVTNSLNLSPKAVHIALDDTKVIAFSAYEGNNRGTGWFGPMGTTEACRGRRIGGILLKRCLVDLSNRGYDKAIIPWVGPIGFYAHQVGAKMSSIYWRYEKLVKDA